MSDEDAFLSAICADPADDTARLVFADLLQECGGSVETAWATFIRAHVRLVTDTATAGDIPDVCEYGSEPWLKRFVQRLGLAAVRDVRFEHWERGFPSCLSGGYLELRREWEGLLDRVPIRQLCISSMEDEAVEDFVLWPRLERLTALTVSTLDDMWITRTLSERGVAALTRCRALAGLEELSLVGLEVTERIADLFLQSNNLTGLRHLSLEIGRDQPAPAPQTRDRLRERFGIKVVRLWPYR